MKCNINICYLQWHHGREFGKGRKEKGTIAHPKFFAVGKMLENLLVGKFTQKCKI